MTNTTNTEEAKILADLTAEERLHLDGGEPAPQVEISDEEERAALAPVFTARAPANAAEIEASLDRDETDLTQQFDEGDITAREYRDGVARLNDQRAELRWQKQKAELAADMRSQAEFDAWNREVENFMTKGPGAGLSKSHAAMVAFDDIVKQVTSDPANQKLSDRAQLAKAYKIYSADMAKAGIGSADQIELARSLGDMGGGRGGADFGSIDAMIAKGDLSGVERALSRMSKDDRDRYGL